MPRLISSLTSVAALTAALCLAGCSAEISDADSLSQAEVVNKDPDFLVVYNNNIENLETSNEKCAGDWTDLIDYMDQRQLSPDVFTVQQVSGASMLKELTDRMNSHLRGTWKWIVADPTPDSMMSPCGHWKEYQTNGIIYRPDRLEPVGEKVTWKAWRLLGGSCRRDPRARTLEVLQQFHDLRADKIVTITSVHWSTTNGCEAENIREIGQRMQDTKRASALNVFGGDFNDPDRVGATGTDYEGWYTQANGELGGKLNYRDPIFSDCKAGSSGMNNCLNNNWTIGQRARIDFIFAQTGDGSMAKTSAAHTITFDEADHASRVQNGSDTALNYSQHRALRARVHY